MALDGQDNVLVVGYSNQGSPGTRYDVAVARLIGASNTAPVFDAGSTQTLTIAEESLDGAVVGSAAATDADLDTLTYSISGAPAGAFQIDNSGQITIGNASLLDLDFDDGTAQVAQLTVTVNDGTEDVVQLITVNVHAVNDNTPAFTSANSVNTVENSSNSLQTVSATDADLPAQIVTLSITGNGPDNALFQLTASNQLEFITAPDFETHRSMPMVTTSMRSSFKPTMGMA